MLEKFCRHIASGGRSLFRNKRQRRMLHSNFWLHGVEELTPLLDSLSVCVRGVLTAEVEALNRRLMGETIHLEFLYPLRTLAFLKQFSRHRLASSTPLSSRRRRTIHCERYYSTGAKTDGDASAETSNLATDHYKSLKFLIKEFAPGHYDEAWRHVQNELATVSPHLINRTMEYLGTSDRKVDQVRIIELGARLQTSDFNSEGCEALTKAFLDRRKADDAYLLVNKVVEFNPFLALKAIGKLIAFGVDEDRWILAQRAFNLVPASLIDNTKRIAPEVIISQVHGFKTKYLSWMKEKPRGTYAPALAQWLGTGGLTSGLSRKTSEGAMEAYYYLRIIHREGWSAGVALSVWLDLMKQLQEHALHEAATETYLIYRDTPLRESPTAAEIATILYGTLKSFGHLGDFRNMERVFDDWFHFGSRPNEEACLYIMRQFARRGEVSVMKEFYNYYTSRFQIRIAVIEAMMHAYAIRGEIDEVHHWFDRLVDLELRPTRVVYNILIYAYKQADDVDSAFRRFYIMWNSRGETRPDIITFQTLLSLCANRGDIEAVEHLLSKMREQGIAPNQSIYNAVTFAYVKQRDVNVTQQASIIVNEVYRIKQDKKGGDPTRMWNNILVGYLWAQDLNQMAATYHQMRNEKIPFDSHTYAILMHSLCLTGKVSEADRMLEILEKDQSVKLNQTHYATIMLDHMLRKEIEKVWTAYNRMLKAGLTPTFITQAILIQVVASAEYREYRRLGGVLFLREAEAILAQATSDLSVLDLQSPDKVKSAIPPTLFVPLLQVYAREGSHERAVELFQRFMAIQEQKIPGNTKPDLAMYLHVANALLRSGDTKLLLSIWDEAKAVALRQAKRVIHGMPMPTTKNQKTVLPKDTRILCPLFSVVVRALSLDQNTSKLAWERDQFLYHGFHMDNININDMVQAFILNNRPVQAFTLCEEALMPGYADRVMELRGEKSMPEFYPFLRTQECLLAEIQTYIHSPEQKGVKSGESIMRRLQRDCPKTWTVLNELDSVEFRIGKERIFQQSRLDWGRQQSQTTLPKYDESADTTMFVKVLMEDVKNDIARNKRVRQTENRLNPTPMEVLADKENVLA